MQMREFIKLLFFGCLLVSQTKSSSLSSTTNSNAAKDIVDLIRGVVTTVKEIWQIVDNSNTEINMPIIVQRLEELSKEIKKTEDRYSESISSFLNVNKILKEDYLTETINSITTRFEELQSYIKHQHKLEYSTLVQFAEWVVSPSGFSVNRVMDRFYLTVFGGDDATKKPGINLFETIVENYAQNDKCTNQQSTQQFIYSLYTDVALAELKAYTMIEFSWIILRAYGKGDYRQEAQIMRDNYEKRREKNLSRLRDVMQHADRLVWRCDPAHHVEGKTYEQVTRFLQGYVENEVDMSSTRECTQACSSYGRTKNEGCYMNQFCSKQERCSGQIHDCRYTAWSMNICPSPKQDLRRYEYIKYGGKTFGKNNGCNQGESEALSWMRYLFWECNYCYCLCDDYDTSKTERYFNLRDTLSDVNDNKVVTGIRFVKENRVFHLQIQQGQLLPLGSINDTSVAWKRIDNYTINESGVNKNQDYFMLTYDTRSIDLDDLQADESNYVVTGVRFRLVEGHLNLQVRFSKYNFETGELINPLENSYWKLNNVKEYKRSELSLTDLDIPTLSPGKTQLDSKHNQYLQFSPTSFVDDAAQTTIPFIDIQDVTSTPAVPLAGIGIYHKGKTGYGGYIAPKIWTYDFVPHIPNGYKIKFSF